MPDTFAGWLKNRRKERDLTQKELAARIGYAPVSIQKIEEGKRRPSKQMAALLAAQLGIAAADQASFILSARQGQAPTAALGAPPIPRLPAPLTSFVGREQETAALARHFAGGETRLITLLGPPGVGKTRLALAAAWALAPGLRQGAVFVDLAPVHAAQVPGAILAALNLQAPENAELPALRDHLAGREMLLLLDNCEHVLAAAPLVAELLAAAPRLQVLATSREPLRLYGETRFSVAPLPLGGAEQAAAAQSPAAALFAARARAMRPSFAITAQNAPLVDAICRRLDGLPLALELAAVQTRQFTLPDLLASLEGCLAILSQQRSNVPQRHLSLMAAVTWSTNLLSERRRQSFYTLGLFRGGFTAGAARAVSGGQDLAGLVAASLVQDAGPPYAGGEDRYTLLETMREMALAALAGAPGAAARRRHALYYHDLADRACAAHGTAALPQWQARLALEKENVRAALAWCLENDPLLGLKLARNMWRYWYLWGEYRQGLRWLEGFLALHETADELRAEALNGAGVLLTRFGEFERARPYFQACLQIGRSLRSIPNITAAQIGLAECDGARGDYEAGRPRYEEALALFETIDDNRGISWALCGLAVYEEKARDDLAAAAAIMAESVEFARQDEDARHLGWFLCILADFLRDLGDGQRAEVCLAEGLSLVIAAADRPGQAFSKLRLAGLAIEQGAPARARPYLGDAIGLAYETYTLSYAAQGIALAGLLLLDEGESGRGVLLCAAAEALFAPLRGRLLQADVRLLEARLAAARDVLGEARYASAWQEGSALGLAEAVDLAHASLG